MRPSTSHKQVGVVILNYNNAAATIECLKSIVAHSDRAYRKIVVVDNGSARECIEEVNAYIQSVAELTVIEYDCLAVEPVTLGGFTHLLVNKNLGYACGNNCGCEVLFRDADVDKILIMNNDTLIVDDMVSKLAQRYDTLEGQGLLSPLIISRDFHTVDYCSARRSPTLSEILKGWLLLHRNVGGILQRITEGQYLLSQDNIAAEDVVAIDIPSGSCIMVDKELFREIGGFDPHTFLYYEENILFAKLNKIGRRNFVDCGCRCIHLGADTTATKISSGVVARALCDSVQYYVKHYTDASLLYRLTLKLFCRLFRWKVALKSIL